VDYRADLYALGCVAYWLVTGRLVFDAPNALQLMFQHAHAEPVPPSRKTELPIPAGFDEVVLACLAKRPDDRPRSAADVAQRLTASLNGQRWTSERAERWWERHRPEQAREAPTCCDLTLTKELDAEGEPAEDPAAGATA
jgi:serine/threonine-protein kinase